MRTKVIIEMDTSNMGSVVRLYEEGIFYKFTSVPLTPTVSDHEKAVEKAKEYRNGHSTTSHKRSKSPEGLDIQQLVLAIMQSDDDHPWHYSEVGMKLKTTWDKNPNSASPAMTPLVNAGYVERVGGGTYLLTEKGRKWDQKTPLETEDEDHQITVEQGL